MRFSWHVYAAVIGAAAFSGLLLYTHGLAFLTVGAWAVIVLYTACGAFLAGIQTQRAKEPRDA